MLLKMLAACKGAGGAPTPSVVWNSADKAANITLTNGDLTAETSSSAGWGDSVRATLGRSSGKYYYEIYLETTSTANLHGGFALASASNATYYGAAAQNSYSCYHFSSSIRVFFNGGFTDYSTTASGTTYTMNFAVDFSTNSLWVGVNGDWAGTGDPATGTSATKTIAAGTYYPGACFYISGQYATFRGLASSMAYTIPSGFSAWDS
jgi:hypothetical protein